MNIKRNNIKYASCLITDDVLVALSGFNNFENRTLGRPLSGGLSIGGFLNMYGTLGGLFRDDTDGTIVGLTCRHVCDQMISTIVEGFEKDSPTQPPPLLPISRDFVKTRFTSLSDRLSEDFFLNNTPLYKNLYVDNFNREYNDFLYDRIYRGRTYVVRTLYRVDTQAAKNTSIMQVPIYQPGYPLFNTNTYANFITGWSVPADARLAKPYPYTIGHIKRAIPLQTDTRLYNEIDSALIAIENTPTITGLLDKNSCKYIGFNNNSGSVFATTDEINALDSNTPLFKTGAGTGPVGEGCIDAPCYKLKFEDYYDLIAVEGVNYINGLSFSISALNNDIISLSTLEGDSGSMLWALLSSTIPTASAWKIVGQIFAYSNEATPIICYASRIDNIVKALKISPWNGSNIVYTPSVPKYFTAFTKADAIQKLGRTCYFVGMTTTLSASYNITEDQVFDTRGNYGY